MTSLLWGGGHLGRPGLWGSCAGGGGVATGLGGAHTPGPLPHPATLDARSLGLAKWLAVCVSTAKWQRVTRPDFLELSGEEVARRWRRAEGRGTGEERWLASVSGLPAASQHLFPGQLQPDSAALPVHLECIHFMDLGLPLLASLTPSGFLLLRLLIPAPGPLLHLSSPPGCSFRVSQGSLLRFLMGLGSSVPCTERPSLTPPLSSQSGSPSPSIESSPLISFLATLSSSHFSS